MLCDVLDLADSLTARTRPGFTLPTLCERTGLTRGVRPEGEEAKPLLLVAAFVFGFYVVAADIAFTRSFSGSLIGVLSFMFYLIEPAGLCFS